MLALESCSSGSLAARDQPVYIVEIGAGHAKMAFLTLHMLAKMREFFPSARPFKYIITDFTQSNVDFWDKHPPLQKYFDAGVLDMAKFGAWGRAFRPSPPPPHPVPFFAARGLCSTRVHYLP